MMRTPARSHTIGALTLAALLGGMLAAPAQAGPEACPIPTIDDRCEAWVHRYTEGEGDAPFARHKTNSALAGALTSSGKTAFALGYRIDWPRTVKYEMQTVAYDVATGAVRWVNYEAGPAEEWAILPRIVAVSADDAVVYVVGTAFVDPGSAKDPRIILVAAYDAATGARLWRTIHDGPFLIDDAFAAAVSPVDDRLYVAGSVQVSSHPVSTSGFGALFTDRGLHAAGIEVDLDFALLAFDGGSGELLEQSTYGGSRFTVDDETVASWDVATDIQVSADGERIAISGLSSGREAYGTGRSQSTVVVWERDADDAGSWTPAWTREMPGVPLGLVDVPERSTYVFAGTYPEVASSSNPYDVVALDAADGATRWKTRFALGGGSTRVEFPRALLLDEERGTVYLPGLSRYSGSSNGTAGVLALRDSDGSVLWQKRLTDPRTQATIIFNYDNDQMPVGAFDPVSGHVQLASYREGRVVTFSLDRASGAQRWAATFDYPLRQGPLLEQSSVDWPVAIEAAAGKTVVFGNSYIPYRDSCTSGNLTLPCSRNDFLTIVYEV